MEYLIILRLVHILSTVFWTGSMIYFALFVIPAFQSLGSEGNKFIQQLTRTNKMPVIMNIAATFSIISGMLLMQRLFGTFKLEWVSSLHLIILVIGGLFALVGYVIGITVNFPTARRMSAIGKVVATTGQIPSQNQLAELSRLRKKSFCAGRIIAILLFLSLILMSIVRYF